jgi:branched-chain amino acid transport system substrate-binding protein
MAAAVKAVRGNVEDRRIFLEALKKVEMKTAPRGPMIMDPYGNPVQNIYIRKVERVGGELQNSIIHTFPNVSQFWKYKPEEYMQKPFYGREYSP